MLARPVTWLSKEISYFHIALQLSLIYLSPNTAYTRYNLEIMITIGPAAKLSLIVNEKHIYSCRRRNVLIVCGCLVRSAHRTLTARLW